VSNCYATGTVTGSNNVGGIAGEVVTGAIESCAALNPAIVRISSSTGTDFGRVAGSNSGALGANAAFSGMTANGGISFGGGALDGSGLAAGYGLGEISNPDTWFGWPFGENDATPWVWGADLYPAYPLPVLYWQTKAQIPAALPTHLQP